MSWQASVPSALFGVSALLNVVAAYRGRNLNLDNGHREYTPAGRRMLLAAVVSAAGALVLLILRDYPA